MTTRKATSNTDSADTFHRSVHSVMPRPMPATSAIGSDLKRATTATASPGRMVVVPTAPSGTTPVNGALVTNVTVDNPPATAQTIVCSRRDRNAEQQGAVLVLGGGPHRPSGVGAEQEPAETDEDDRGDDEHQHVVATNRVGAHEPAAAERRLDVADERVGPERDADDEADRAEDLRQADRSDRQHEP